MSRPLCRRHLTSQKAALLCCAAIISAFFATTGPSEARQRLKDPERTKKEQSAPTPPGPHLLIVSLKSQHATLYSNGAPVARTPISSGTASHPTPTGVFSVIQKNRHHRSNIYSGAPMPYMQRLTWSGIALHQGQLPGYPASHGCIRLPESFANFLWRTTKLGARVIVTRDDITPSEISHAALFQTKPAVTTADATPPVLRRSLETEVASNTAATQIASDATEAEKPIEAPSHAAAKTEDAAPKPVEAAKPAERAADIPSPILASFFDTLESKIKKPAPSGPVSIFISRKDKQLYVRQGFQALFNVPVKFRDETAPLGTHVFTALDKGDGPNKLHWVAMSMPPELPKADRKIAVDEPKTVYRYDDYGRRVPVRAKASQIQKTAEPAVPTIAASAALDRIDLPQDITNRLSEYVTAGATLIISDQGLGYETGAYTDFIILTH